MLYIMGPQISSTVEISHFFFTYHFWELGTHFLHITIKYNFLRSEIVIFYFFVFFYDFGAFSTLGHRRIYIIVNLATFLPTPRWKTISETMKKRKTQKILISGCGKLCLIAAYQKWVPNSQEWWVKKKCDISTVDEIWCLKMCNIPSSEWLHTGEEPNRAWNLQISWFLLNSINHNF